MATTGPAQRRWRAACPNCGAPVEFASAASPVAVCSYCRSTLARDGESLRRIGTVAEVFDDHSPLRIGSAGRWQGVAFTLLGRMQLQSPIGRWNEWHALFDTGRSGWLVEDNGRHVLSFEAPAPPDLPAAGTLRPGQGLALDGRSWSVASIVPARVTAAEGELPAAPVTDRDLTVVELRNAQGEVASFDDAEQPPTRWALGRAVELPELALTGLREEESEAQLGSRSLPCPSCGAALVPRLDGTRSIVCPQCQAVVDLSAGAGADLAHYAQAQSGAELPLLPLGTTGQLALAGRPAEAWQVVGFMVRREEDEEESATWREYLLYRRQRGFVFLVDSDEGWSWVAPLTGAPTLRGELAQWEGRSYQQKYSYAARTVYVQGEFYWPVRRDQRSHNTDYAGGPHRLNREQADGEITWSAGETLDGPAVARAFGLPEKDHAALARETVPIGSAVALGKTVVIGVLVLLAVALLLATCSEDDCDDVRATFGAASNEYQQCRANSSRGSGRTSSGGGSWGGGHK